MGGAADDLGAVDQVGLADATGVVQALQPQMRPPASTKEASSSGKPGKPSAWTVAA
jgi:hypothetical protein